MPSRLDFVPRSWTWSQWLAGVGFVSEDGGLAPGIEDHHVDVAVVVEIVERRPAAAELRQQAVAALVGDIDEPALAVVSEENVAGVVTRGVIELFDVVDQMAAGDEQIPVTVVVEIDHPGPPGDLRIGVGAGAGLAG